jgi:hypothetical protein
VSDGDVSSFDEFDWVFPDLSRRGAGQGGDLTQFTIRGDLETFVREVLQNSNDAAIQDNDDPVKVIFRIQELTGTDLDTFKRVFGWRKWKSQVESAAREDNQIAQRIDRFADGVEDSLRVLTVEDRNTEGLTGPDEDGPKTGSTNFSALVRDSLESNKSDETAGGKFGLGKAVLRIFSGTSTVLFNSVLSESYPRPGPRLIGRTRLPQHWRGETRHNGHGFLGDTRVSDDEYDPPGSVWGEDATTLAEALSIGRPDGDTPGTSIMIVGFRDPQRESRREVEDLAAAIREEAVKWFWPAIWRDQLRVSVETADTTYEADLDSVRHVRPFVDCLERPEDDLVDDPDQEADVARRELSVSIPDKQDADETKMPDEGRTQLSVRLTLDDRFDYTNHVAFVRGAGMVVRYWNRDKLVRGNRNFHAVLLAGEACTWTSDGEPTSDDTKVESFFKDAEPPAHDDWEQTDATRDDYKQGTRRAIEDLKDAVQETIARLAGPNFERGARGPERLGNRFPISNEGRDNGPTGKSNVTGNVHIRRDADSGRWVFEADVRPSNSDFEIVGIDVSLPRMGEERQLQSEYLGIKSFDEIPDGCASRQNDDGGYNIRVPDGRSNVRIKGRSNIDFVNAKTRLNIEATVRRVDAREGGD